MSRVATKPQKIISTIGDEWGRRGWWWMVKLEGGVGASEGDDALQGQSRAQCAAAPGGLAG